MKEYLPLLIFILSLCSCQDRDLVEDKTQANNLSVQSNPVLEHILRDINLSHTNEGLTRTESSKQLSYRLTPLVEYGDTLLYIVQYPEGWRIYSTEVSRPMIIFYSNKGTFNINDPQMPEAFKEILKMELSETRMAKKNKTGIADISWGALAVTKEEIANGKLFLTSNKKRRQLTQSNSVPNGTWVLIDEEIIDSDSKNSGRLTNTLWAQDSPWNQYCPLIVDNSGNRQNSLVGCTAVAVGQYEYYTHYKENIPKSTMSVSTLATDNLTFKYSELSESIWNKMALNYLFTYGIPEVATHLGYVGKELKSEYGLEGTGVLYDDCLNYLNAVYGGVFHRTYLSTINLTESLDKGYLLLAYLEAEKTDNGTPLDGIMSHALLIDHYGQTTYTKNIPMV